MASSTMDFSIFLLLTLFFSLHVHARDSQFFSKVSTTNNPEETQLIPDKEQVPLNKQQEKETNFIPENQNNGGYGLYGHESGQLPPSTTTTENLPYKSEAKETFQKGGYPNSNSEKDKFYYNEDAYVTPITSNNKNNNYYNGGDMYNGRQQGMGETRLSTRGNKYNAERQGMSDTRFLENGKYFYDLDSENYNNVNANQNSRSFNPRNEFYNNRGQYENNGNSFGSRNEFYNNRGQYENNGNSFGSRNEFYNNRGQYENNGNSFGPKKEFYNNRGQYGNYDNSYDQFDNSMEGNSQNQEEYQESQDDEFNP